MNGGTLTMGSGIFQAVFQSGEHTECGIAIISRGTIHGGFASFYYRGTYKEHEGHTISGTLEFHKYAQLPNSIFDKRQGSRLVLNGTVDEQLFELSGQMQGEQDSTIQIHFKKVSDLVEPT